MIKRSTFLHLRIPFSIYLMPVFFFAASSPPVVFSWQLLVAFIAIHFFLYPASNGYNSYFDKDEKSIGGLENPPAVDKELYYVSLVFDVVALLLGFLINWRFSLMMFIYGLVSKAYSHPAIRLKKYAVPSLLAAALFQGGFTYLMVFQALHKLTFYALTQHYILFPALLSTMMITGFYPMTQVYQHEEDSKRGDHTFSLMMGIRGTFLFSGIVFLLSDIGFYFYFQEYFSVSHFLLFNIFLLPLFIYFIMWFLRVLKDEQYANFKATMMMNRVASVSLIAFFLFSALLEL